MFVSGVEPVALGLVTAIVAVSMSPLLFAKTTPRYPSDDFFSKIFNWPNNPEAREASWDFDDFWTKLIAST